MGSGLFQLHQFIVEYYALEELKELSFLLGVNYEDLGGERISSKARELILLLGSERRLDELLANLSDKRSELFVAAGFSSDPMGLDSLYDVCLPMRRQGSFPS